MLRPRPTVRHAEQQADAEADTKRGELMGKHSHQVSTTQRQLGYPHQRLRSRLLPQAYGTPCPKCGKLMLQGQDLDLDHDLPRALGGRAGQGRMAHRHCNRSHGAKLGQAMRKARKLPTQRISSRRW